MGKLVWFVLILVCVLSLVACNNILPERVGSDFTEQYIIIRDSYSDVLGVFVQVSGIYVYPDKTTLVVSWNNTTEHTVTYGENFKIEYKEDGEWSDCTLKENVSLRGSFLLNAYECHNKEYAIIDMYDISKPGKYRFLSACSVDMGKRGTTECSVWSEFIIN